MRLTRLVDAILGMIAIEFLVLGRTARRQALPHVTTAALACNLGAGAVLLLAIRQQVDTERPVRVLACLTGSLVLHLGDLRSRNLL